MRPSDRSLGLALTLALAAALLGCGARTSEPITVESGGLALEARVSPAVLRVGQNRLALELRDAQGTALPGAHVEAAVRMHAMGAMPAMGGAVPVRELGDGRYQADFALEMGGTWQLELTAHAPSGATLRAEGALTVGSTGLRLAPAASASPPAADSPASYAGHGAPAAPAPPSDGAPGAFSFPPERLQEIGVRTEPAARRPLARTLRAVARVAYDESALADVSTKVSGWIDSLAVAAEGDPIERGQVLFTLYSPDLYAAQLEYLQALGSEARAADSARRESAGALLRAARRRLALLGVAEVDIAALAKRSEPREALPIRAPLGGFVVEKNAVTGAAVQAGERLLRIAPRDRVWLEAEIPESELGLAREGAPVRAYLASAPERALAGRVLRLAPGVSREARTASARIALDEPTKDLRPGMWANVELDAPSFEGIAVPSTAVLRAGERSFVFVATGGGRFEPRAVELGLELPDAVEIRSGLAAGEQVVTSGTYLIASESRLRAALSQWR